MIKRFCDICSTEIKWLLGNRITINEQTEEEWNDYEYEICPSCTQKVKNFIKELKKNG